MENRRLMSKSHSFVCWKKQSRVVDKMFTREESTETVTNLAQEQGREKDAIPSWRKLDNQTIEILEGTLSREMKNAGYIIFQIMSVDNEKIVTTFKKLRNREGNQGK